MSPGFESSGRHTRRPLLVLLEAPREALVAGRWREAVGLKVRRLLVERRQRDACAPRPLVRVRVRLRLRVRLRVRAR